MERIRNVSSSNHKPLITIIIPCYNYGKYLSDAISSCLAQTYRHVEIIIIDDGSTDNSQEVANKYLKKGVKYIFQKNAGPAAARNRGILEAQGEYICFLDADDIFKPEYIQACYVILSKSPAHVGFVYSAINFIGNIERVESGRDYNMELLKRENYINASALFRANALKKYRFNEHMRGGLEDWDLFLTLAENGIEGRLQKLPLLQYRKHSSEIQSISDKIDNELTINRLQLGVQLRHIGFVGYCRIIHSMARITRLGLGIKR